MTLLRRKAKRAHDTIVTEHIDEESGDKATRKQFQQLMRDAEKRQFDLVHVFALDRFSSEGIEAVSEHTARLDQCGVEFWSYCEPMLNTTGPMAALYRAIIAWAAGYRNQVRLGQARKHAQIEATDEEYQHGRRSVGDDVAMKVRELATHGLSRRKIAEAASVSVGTVHNYLKADI